MFRNKNKSLALAGAALLAFPATVHAQEAPAAASEKGTVYEASFFASYAPTSALDVVRRVPGFAIEETDDNVRGYSGSAGNVVINGARPSSKSDSLQTILARIPAAHVVRIEVASGERFGSDYAGKSQVVNVIVSASSGIDGSVEASVTRLPDGRLSPDGEASVSLRRGKSTTTLSAGAQAEKTYEEGYDEVFALPSGQSIEYRRKVNTTHSLFPFGAINWGHEDGAKRSAHLNARVEDGHFHLDQANHVTPLGAAVRDDKLAQDFRKTSYEIGGDLTRPLLNGAVKFVALANRKDRKIRDYVLNRVNGQTLGGFATDADSRYDEVLGRVTWSRESLAGFSFEFGSEVAYNRLENATEIYAIGLNDIRTRIPLPVTNATVDELRTEQYLNLGRQLSKRLHLDTSLAYETSHLKVVGDTHADRALRFVKPGMTLDYSGDKGLRLRASLRRTVSQLNFDDFIAQAEVTNTRISGGNAELQPQRAWEAEISLEKPVFGDGKLRMAFQHGWVSGLLDRVLTPQGYDALGNLGSAQTSLASLTLDTPLTVIGARSTRLRIDASYRETSVHDPLTGKVRTWSGEFPKWSWNVDLRHDKGAWAFGGSLGTNTPFTTFRIDELDRFIPPKLAGELFAEYRRDKRTTVRFTVYNPLDRPAQRERLFFNPDRSSAAPFLREFRERNSHLQFQLKFKRTFSS